MVHEENPPKPRGRPPKFKDNLDEELTIRVKSSNKEEMKKLLEKARDKEYLSPSSKPRSVKEENKKTHEKTQKKSNEKYASFSSQLNKIRAIRRPKIEVTTEPKKKPENWSLKTQLKNIPEEFR